MGVLLKTFFSEKGGVLVYVLMGITLLTILLFTAFVVSSQSMSNAVYAQMNAQSRYTAEAGLEKAIRQLLNESNKSQALNQAIRDRQGVWIPREPLEITEVGYTSEYEVIVIEITPTRVYEFISSAYTNGTRTVELQLKKRISFGYQPFPYVSSPVFDYAVYTPGVMESKKGSDLEITGGNIYLAGDLKTDGELKLNNLTFCLEGKNNHKGEMKKENVVEDCSFPELDVEEEMAKLYDRLVELSKTRNDIYMLTKGELKINDDDIVDNKWVQDGISYSVIIAPKITIKTDEEFGTESSPFLIFAGTTEKSGEFKTGIVSVEKELKLNGFVLGERIEKTRSSDVGFEINGGIIMTDRINLYEEAEIVYPELSGGTFTETFID
jgi:hypothetical protein